MSVSPHMGAQMKNIIMEVFGRCLATRKGFHCWLRVLDSNQRMMASRAITFSRLGERALLVGPLVLETRTLKL